MIYVYAIVDDPAPSLDGLRGMVGSPVFGVAVGDFAAVCSVHDHIDLTVSSGSLWQHEKVTAELLGFYSVVPVRFATVVTAIEEVRAMLAAQGAALSRQLSYVRGKVEMAVRATVQGGNPNAPVLYAKTKTTLPSGHTPKDQPSCGRSYLQALQDDWRRKSPPLPSALEAIHLSLVAHSEATVLQPTDYGTSVAAYLVRATATDAFRTAALDARERQHDVRLALTGPWAPFTFVGERLNAGDVRA